MNTNPSQARKSEEPTAASGEKNHTQMQDGAQGSTHGSAQDSAQGSTQDITPGSAQGSSQDGAQGITHGSAQDGAYNPTKRWAALAILSLSLLTVTVDMTILNVALPHMAEELQPTASQQLWIIDGYSLVMAGMLISMSSIADRLGRKRILMSGYVILATASILVLWANHAEFVIALRLLLGVGAAMIMPSTLSLLRVIFTDLKERATALAVWASVAGVGAAIGPLIGGFVLEHFNWHAAFLIAVPMMVLAFVGAAITLPESRVPNPGRWDWFAALQSLVGMATVMWAVKRFSAEGTLADAPALVMLLLGLAIMTWFVLRCRASAAPLLNIQMFTHRVFSAGVLAATIASFAMSAGLLLLAQWLQLVHGSTAMQSGIQLMPLAITAAICSLLAPPVAEKIGIRATVFGGLIATGLGLMYIGVVGAGLTLGHVYVSLGLIGIGIGALAIGSSMIMGGVPKSLAGNAAAMEDTAYEFGAVLGIALLGSLASFLYRHQLQHAPAIQALDGPSAAVAQDSLGGAVAIAQAAGAPDVAVAAGQAFSAGLGTTGLIGGALLVVAAFAVFFLTPKGTQITNLEH